MKAGYMERRLADCETMGDVMDVFLSCRSLEDTEEFIKAYAGKHGWGRARENLNFGLSYYEGFPNIENIRHWSKKSGLLAKTDGEGKV